MNLETKINEELKAAMKAKETVRIDALRSLRSAIIEFNKSGAGHEMNEEEALAILRSAAKKRRDSIDMYLKGNRQDLADKEKEELKVIEEFLPEQMSEEEVEKVVSGIIADTGAESMKDMGKVMGAAMKALQGKADGNIVQKIVKDKLS